MTELELMKLMWNGLLTLAAAGGAWAWKFVNKRVDDMDNHYNLLTNELNHVKLDYLKKEEIEKVESRIDKRFDEMRALILELIKNKKGVNDGL